MKQPGTSAEAFDHIGARYDVEFTNTELSRWFRQRAWERLAALYQPGDTVVEFGCGTGEDAIFLAKRGVRVLASDGSPASRHTCNRTRPIRLTIRSSSKAAAM